ncbi:MAG: hypothetical protein Q8P70_00890, partial [bacterium]|nr:hypothetical protein [bacterium]
KEGERCPDNVCGDSSLNCVSGICVKKKIVERFTDVGGLIGAVERILNIVFAVLLVVVVVMLVWGSIEFVTSAGEEKAVSGARSKMMYAVIGLVLALIAAGIPPLIRSIVGIE